MQKHYIVGTAGHIDHGKTTLSKALTGKDTDRLKEEKERNISIELGFAPFLLPNGDQVSLIDVPGHEKFIRHMVAGVGGIDLVLLVIAADEGIMPQTKEHMQIIELLGIEHGVIVLTKKDLIDDEFLQLVVEEVKETIEDTILKDAPIICVSSTTNEGIEELKQMIQNQLQLIPERTYTGFFRMPIDRVFTLKGIGTVVTGTVYSGNVEVGQELEILPSNHKVRVRSLQVHSESVDQAFAGQRVAINLTGIEIEDLKRGDSVVTPKQWEPSERVDIQLHILKDIDFSIKQNTEVKFHVGTSEVLGTLLLYDRKEALPGDTVYCQIKLEEPIISSRKERFIIRRPSPAATIGGGMIIEPNAEKHKYRQETVELLKQKSKGTLEDLLLHQFLTLPQIFLSLTDLSNLFVLPDTEILVGVNKLIQNHKVSPFNQSSVPFYASSDRLAELENKITSFLEGYHTTYSIRKGQAKSELIKQFLPKIKPKMAQEILQYWQDKNLLKVKDDYISLFAFSPHLPEELRKKAELLEKKLIQQEFNPDTWDDLTKEFGINDKEKNELFSFLINQGRIYKLTDKMVIHAQSFDKLKKLVTDFLMKEKQITIQQAKDLLNVSRKYLVPLLELLDQEKVTVLRQGQNYRELRSLN
ncbi:selenocysteine-specific translation elongation factor [Tepidibacillus sp. HK-1]|uniref:selenocysteine-specific translation elongation factor n=1 Tax=Tepidibacillus sp. HK-1 TaxID=1883407 RepID=UPI000852A54B|nr:selenocysteine-specific translation elongation factor [Tepidibacillus sp. HK-1]GBF10960.1 selenocysteine-specific elongation factor [Tepidibacillus sp. HK-1]